jgi:hypothetical protein
MSNNLLVSPPHWCKYAIPSVRGWCDPKTGELLIAVRGIKFEQVKVVEVGEKAEIPALLKPQVQIGVPSTKDPIVSTAASTNETAEVAEIVAEVKDVVEVVETPVEKKKTAAKKTTAKKTTTRKSTKKKATAAE